MLALSRQTLSQKLYVVFNTSLYLFGIDCGETCKKTCAIYVKCRNAFNINALNAEMRFNIDRQGTYHFTNTNCSFYTSSNITVTSKNWPMLHLLLIIPLRAGRWKLHMFAYVPLSVCALVQGSNFWFIATLPLRAYNCLHSYSSQTLIVISTSNYFIVLHF